MMSFKKWLQQHNQFQDFVESKEVKYFCGFIIEENIWILICVGKQEIHRKINKVFTAIHVKMHGMHNQNFHVLLTLFDRRNLFILSWISAVNCVQYVLKPPKGYFLTVFLLILIDFDIFPVFVWMVNCCSKFWEQPGKTPDVSYFL